MMKRLIVCTSIAVFTTISLAQTPVQPAASPAVSGTPVMAQPGSTGNQLKASEDAEFLKKAASGGMYEVASSQIATTASQNADVKAFAQRMVQDHTAANQELKALAEQKNVTLPASMNANHQQMLNRLNKAEGENFDKLYVNQQNRAHEQAVALYEKAAADANDPDLKAFASRTLPTLQAHLEQAKKLKTD